MMKNGYNYFKNMSEEFRLENIDETRSSSLKKYELINTERLVQL